MDEIASRVQERFTKAFGRLPEVVACAPGRVEVLGNHTDYNEGYVLSFAIDKAIWAAAGRSTSGSFQLTSSHFADSVVDVPSAVKQTENRWTNYVLGVHAVLDRAGFPVSPFSMAFEGNIPLGAGLSSSAALEVATGMALSALFDFSVPPADLAAYCREAENTYAGTQCGLLDQYSSIFGKQGHVLFIDFRTLEHRTVALPSSDLCVAVTTSGVSHSLVESAYNDRRAECRRAASFFAQSDPGIRTLRDVTPELVAAAKGELDDAAYRRALHIVGENRRVKEGIAMLEQGDLERFGALLWESHESSRVNFENSCPELDVLVDIARTVDGVYGSRLTGGGFGGATLCLLHRDNREQFESTIRREYTARTGHEAMVYFASVHDGARIVRS